MGLLDDLAAGIQRIGAMATAEARARRMAWQALAARRGGVYLEAQGVLGGGRPTVDLVVRDVAVHLDTYTVKGEHSSTTYTRFRAAYLLPVGPVFKVVPDNIVSSLGTALGFEDVVLSGLPGFDSRYVVRTADVVATRQAFTPELQAQMLRFFPSSSVHANGHVVSLSALGRLKDLARLEAGVDLVAGLAAYGASWVDALRGLPGALWVPPQGPWDGRSPPSVRLDARGVALWVHPVLSGVGLTFCVTAALQREVPPFETSLDASGRPAGGPPVVAEASASLAQVGPGTLGSDGRHLRLVLAGELNERRIVAAVTALADLSLGAVPKGVYR